MTFCSHAPPHRAPPSTQQHTAISRVLESSRVGGAAIADGHGHSEPGLGCIAYGVYAHPSVKGVCA
jgi:hypothetical protein